MNRLLRAPCSGERSIAHKQRAQRAGGRGGAVALLDCESARGALMTGQPRVYASGLEYIFGVLSASELVA